MKATAKLRMSLLYIRLAMGWLFLYAGVTKILNPEWSASGFLAHAQTFPNFYAWFASAGNIEWVNLVNEWGLTLIGIALISGVYVRAASCAGMILMMLYYFPSLSFPYAGEHSLIIDEHIIYVCVLLVLYNVPANAHLGLRALLRDK